MSQCTNKWGEAASTGNQASNASSGIERPADKLSLLSTVNSRVINNYMGKPTSLDSPSFIYMSKLHLLYAIQFGTCECGESYVE